MTEIKDSFTCFPAEKRRVLDVIVDQLKQVDGMAAIVLGGSYASGTYTDSSDIDLGLYYYEDIPFSIAKIRTIARHFSVKSPATVTDFYGWGAWVNGGAWIHSDAGKFDFLYRNIDQVKRTITQAKKGFNLHDFDQQPAYGFYGVIYLAETQACIPLYDPMEVIYSLKQQVKKYPPKLKRNIVMDNLWSAEFTLINARSTASRGDVYTTAGCLTRAAAHLTQVLFALNEKYFMTDKKAMEKIADFPICPHGYIEKVTSILSHPGKTDKELSTSVCHLEQAWQSVVDLPQVDYQPQFII